MCNRHRTHQIQKEEYSYPTNLESVCVPAGYGRPRPRPGPGVAARPRPAPRPRPLLRPQAGPLAHARLSPAPSQGVVAVLHREAALYMVHWSLAYQPTLYLFMQVNRPVYYHLFVRNVIIIFVWKLN